jgi:pyruvate formate lyase activating enzyme
MFVETERYEYDIRTITEDGNYDFYIYCYIDSFDKSIEIRIPYVPSFNDSQMNKIAEFLKSFKNIKAVKVLPYHNYAGSKYSALGMENVLPEIIPDKTDVILAEQVFLENNIPIKR